MNLSDAAAWVATVAVLGAYALVARRPQHLRLYNWVNFWGGISLAGYAFRHHAVASAALSGAYCLIALRALWRR